MGSNRFKDQLNELLRLALSRGASDLHLKAGILPVIRKHGVLKPLSAEIPPLSGADIQHMAEAIMEPQQIEQFLAKKEMDLGYGIAGLGRFRVNVFSQRGTTRMVIRNIPHEIPSFEDLKLPLSLKKLAQLERGLILVTGVTGSGKSSTVAALIDQINRTHNKHILTIEDPIEFLIRDRRSIITQREMGIDTHSFYSSLRGALRQDPDVIFIGEMRDKETIETALLAAETGHLVVSTLHTVDAMETINRILAVFESHQQMQVRLQLAAVLKAIVSQRLARKADGTGFVPACEVLIQNQRVRDMIEDPQKTRYLLQAIEEGHVAYGMQSFDQSLMMLVTAQSITLEEAVKLSTHSEDFLMRYHGIQKLEEKKWDGHDSHQQKIKDQWQDLADVEIEESTQLRETTAANQKAADRKRRTG